MQRSNSTWFQGSQVFLSQSEIPPVERVEGQNGMKKQEKHKLQKRLEYGESISNWKVFMQVCHIGALSLMCKIFWQPLFHLSRENSRRGG
ncbi:hypothetical protein CEXT_113641 [Caerostris extrusa]|uniref:Uncharacterized protein n=1 Tax=Caerostris extrusa TaxID=172846 RepID=A0AAV4WYK1_CAEEX|nr:hypothetical protein CEXT_113641 [Caerostris extrusa]